MYTQKVIFLLAISFMQLSWGKCNRADHAHCNENVVHCPYQQEDIFRCYREKACCYKNEQRREECFFCGCPIEEHTRLKSKKKQQGKKGKEKKIKSVQ